VTKEQFLKLYREGRLQKQAAFENLFGALRSGLGQASRDPLGASLLAMGGMGAVDAIRNAIKDSNLSSEQQHAFLEAIQQNPELQNQDPQKLKAIWKTVVQFAPHVATNSMLLGTYLKNAIRIHGTPILPTDIKQLQDLELGMRGQPERRKLEKGMFNAFGNAFGEAAVKSTVGQLLGGGRKESSEQETELSRVLRLLKERA
jgi:hypothetical protein